MKKSALGLYKNHKLEYIHSQLIHCRPNRRQTFLSSDIVIQAKYSHGYKCVLSDSVTYKVITSMRRDLEKQANILARKS